MKEYIVLRNHDTSNGMALKGNKITYNEVIGQQLIKKGFIAPIMQPVKKVVEIVDRKLLDEISRKRSKKVLSEMLQGEKRQKVIEAINKRLEQLSK